MASATLENIGPQLDKLELILRMAYFERGDERALILCNICNVKCAERGITTHRATCGAKPAHLSKFERGELEKCAYDSSHIVTGGQMESHLEFCLKYQRSLVGEYQKTCQAVELSSEECSRPGQPELGDSSWNKGANSENFISKMGSLHI